MPKIKTTILLTLTFLLLSHQSVFAGTIDTNKIDMNRQPLFVKLKAGFKDMSVGEVIANIISTFLGLLGIIFLILTIHAGFLWMTAGGNYEQVEKAKQSLSRSTIGLIIIVSAFSIMHFVFDNLLI